MRSSQRREQRAQDPRSTDELVRLLLAGSSDAERTDALGVLHARGGDAELRHGLELIESENPLHRIAGADLLGQLGWDARTCLDASVDALCQLLGDSSIEVVAAAGVALGHRRHARAVPHLLQHLEHSSAAVRYGVMAGLTGQTDPRAVAALITLTRDPDYDVRNWATFGLGQETDVDTPSVRDALAARAEDADPEIRGEALIGLARRGDARAYGLVVRELGDDFHGSWVLEAATHLRDPRLLELLDELRARAEPDDQRRFAQDFAEARAACRDASTA